MQLKLAKNFRKLEIKKSCVNCINFYTVFQISIPNEYCKLDQMRVSCYKSKKAINNDEIK